MRLERAYATAPITLPSHASLMTGQYPFRHGVRANGFYRLADESVTLAERLKAAGYATAALVSGFPLASRFGLAQGFDSYDDRFDVVESSGSAYEPERRAADTVTRAVDKLRVLRPPFFLWVHLYDPHAEYEPPEPYRKKHASSPYDGEIAYTDAEMGRLWAELERRGLKDTLVVVAGDHGESLGEHGERTHTIFIYDATIRVPLLFAGAGVKAGHVAASPASLVDVAPTVLEWLGLTGGGQAPALRAEPGDGISLVDALRGGEAPGKREIYFESYAPRLEFGWSQLLGLQADRFKLIEAPRPELYDTHADSDERSDLAARSPGEASRLRDRLFALLGKDPVGHVSRGAPLDAEAIQSLQSLGYLEGSATPAALTGGAPGLPDPKRMIEHQPRIDNALRFMHQGKPHEAARLLREVLAKDPANAFAAQVLSAAMVEQGDPAGSVALLRQVAAKSPALTQSALRASAGDILRRTGALAEAEKELHAALALDAASLQARVLLGLTLLAEGKTEAAASALEEALRLAPSDGRALAALGEVALSRGRHDEARQRFTTAADDAATRVRAIAGLAATEHAARRPREAADTLRRLVSLSVTSSDMDAWQEAGILAAEMGDLALAVSILEKAAKASPGHGSLRRDLGVALSRAGHHERAIEELGRARELLPRDAATCNALGTALARAGRYAEAVKGYEEALRLDPGNAAARENLEAAKSALAGR